MKSTILTFVLPLVFVLFTSNHSYSQKEPKHKEIEIKTSAECGTCKKIIEDKLNYTKGIRFAELDVDSKKLTVSFSTKNLDEAAVKKLVSEIGYDADEIPANSHSQNDLPKCCQPGGMKK